MKKEKPPRKDYGTVCASIPKGYIEEMDLIAVEEDRTRSYIIGRFIKQGLERRRTKTPNPQEP